MKIVTSATPSCIASRGSRPVQSTRKRRTSPQTEAPQRYASITFSGIDFGPSTSSALSFFKL